MLTLIGLRASLLSLAAVIFSGCATTPPSDFKKLNPSRDHYFITATVPDGHTLEASTIYRPANGECPESAEAFDWGVSRQRAELDREKSASENEYSFKSPLSIHILGCQLNAAHSHLTLKLDYGDGRTQETEDMYFTDLETYEKEERHEALRSFRQARLCSHTFYISRLALRLSKFLNCVNAVKDTGGYSPVFAFENLKGKTIHYTFSKDAEDAPTWPRSWLRTADGYRPCIDKDYNSHCESPPEFKQFEMNGQQCDIYPGCKLPERP
ncbi:hypothetical protein [Halopseudomonas bauzanensis]|uniref:hypothetical protein n=1 Tax=Halopseudomonas bauzanensis TaxID=653930 RepID=UPI002555B49D|nr:hypothetical protein [Halopseudomonas bauzanensis]